MILKPVMAILPEPWQILKLKEYRKSKLPASDLAQDVQISVKKHRNVKNKTKQNKAK
jgi:hypothetical protein